MHLINPRLGGAAAALAGLAMAWGFAEQANAQALAATVTSTPSTGMTYVGTDKGNVLDIRLQSGSKFLLDDNGPIQANAGCTPVAGDVTKAICTAFKDANGLTKGFRVFAGNGNDRVTNFTGQAMEAHGEAGRDDLRGSTGPDKLFAGVGDNEDVNGGAGPDLLDGGPGVGDAASYSSRSSNTAVSLDNVANDGHSNGSEGDNVLTSIENLAGGRGDDIFVGSDAANVFASGDGTDLLFGMGGADTLIGGDGSDLLLSSGGILEGSADDGAVDQLVGGGFGSDDPTAVDTCLFSLTDPDVAQGCEQ
jgi:Ca2+-binding RTX toxin-like protein